MLNTIYFSQYLSWRENDRSFSFAWNFDYIYCSLSTWQIGVTCVEAYSTFLLFLNFKIIKDEKITAKMDHIGNPASSLSYTTYTTNGHTIRDKVALLEPYLECFALELGNKLTI